MYPIHLNCNTGTILYRDSKKLFEYCHTTIFEDVPSQIQFNETLLLNSCYHFIIVLLLVHFQGNMMILLQSKKIDQFTWEINPLQPTMFLYLVLTTVR